MLAFLPNLLAHSSKSMGTVVHIGAGVGQEVGLYQTFPFNRVVAVEADAVLFKKLNNKAKRADNLQVENHWIGPKSGNTSVYYFDNPRFNSLLPASNLANHFANLKKSEQKTVQALGINEFILNLGEFDPEQDNILVLDVLGAEAMLIEACSNEVLNFFEWVVVRSSSEILYENSINTDKLMDLLGERDFALRLTDDEHQPFVEHFYQQQRIAKKNKATQEELKKIKRNNAELNERCSKTQTALEQSDITIKQQSSKIEELVGLNEQKEKQLTENATLVDQLRLQLTNLTQSNEVTLTKLKEQDQIATQKHQALAKLQAELTEVNKQLESVKNQLVEKQKQNKKLEESQSTLQHQLKEQDQIATQNHQALAKLQADLIEANKQLESVKNQLVEKQKQNKKLEVSQSTLQYQLKEQEQITTQKQQALAKLQADLANVNKQVDLLKIQFEEGQQQVNKLEEKHASLKQREQTLLEEVASLKLQTKTQTDSFQKYKLDAETQLKEKTEVVDKLENDKNDSSLQMEAIKTEVEKFKNELEKASETKVQLLASSDTLSKSLADTKQKLENEIVQSSLKKQQIIALTKHTRELESERAIMLEKQQSIDLEMTKVEAQIELIKDIVIREKAF
ncbi:FkbM family methyltransferase [Aliiglaciecola sp. 3_MG-2023]|uniref:FkbM family methyltransferase n=1 Tax=Aliiglaciecola sp. 3_MG-2023 TaxID=3062644 RepID=UPI0026E45094|nr:FkbM family methyltransferase [Aliiglaciecola sp. 3_MG-2023]MDO6691937.1 FkbM family methyltransferase [Aliiglaciecola sp. 3_MG-2023]